MDNASSTILRKKVWASSNPKTKMSARKNNNGSTIKDNIVLNPFMGSGATCLVAKKLERIYIGIEKEEKYFNIAKHRLQSIV